MNTLFIAWRAVNAHQGAWGPVGRLDYDDGLFRFCYTRGARSTTGFRPFPKMENLEEVYESVELFPLFANRLLSSSRPDYEEYLRWGGFDPDNPPDPLAVLAVTEGMRQTDAYEVFPCPSQGSDGYYLNKFFLHGLRFISPEGLHRVQGLCPDEPLVVQPDFANPADANAVKVFTSDASTCIGFVPRYLARDVRRLIEECAYIELFVQRVNPRAPLQHRVLCRMRSCWPDHFQPCSDDAFLPIPAEVPSHCIALHSGRTQTTVCAVPIDNTLYISNPNTGSFAIAFDHSAPKPNPNTWFWSGTDGGGATYLLEGTQTQFSLTIDSLSSGSTNTWNCSPFETIIIINGQSYIITK